MRDKIIKLVGLFATLSLVVCLVGSSIVLDTASSYAQTSSLKWTQIPIPAEDNMQLYPGSDIGPMAVSPDGMTVFSAVLSEGSGKWDLLKSTDGAYTWKATGLGVAMATQHDDGGIRDVKLSPSWSSDGVIFVATNNSVYYSEDLGRTFDAMTAVPGTVYGGGTDVITSLALGLGSSDKLVVAVGTMNSTGPVSGGVYISGIGGWTDTGVGTYNVLAVGLSPSYATDATIEAVVSNSSQTLLRTKYSTAAWGAGGQNDVRIKDSNSSDLVSSRACIGFLSDYNPVFSLNLFVGLCAAAPGGDVFRIYTSSHVVYSQDLDVSANGSPSSVNIWSMAVAGSSLMAVIVAGTENAVTTSNGSILVFEGSGSGSNWSWLPNSTDNKQPTGEAHATVVQANSATYVGTCGNQSAVSIALNGVYTSWNQRGLIDTNVDEITDMSPSEGYFSDGEMFITTYDTGTGDASLWRTVTGGTAWERVFCSTLTGVTTCVFDMVRLGTNVANNVVVVAESGSKRIWRSLDGCETFSNKLGTVDIGALLPENITAFTVGSNSSDYYAGGANGSVSSYSDIGATWTSSSGNIPADEGITDLVLTDNGYIYAGTDGGGVYKASTSDLTFDSVDPENNQPGEPGDIVHVAPDLYDGSYVYAGIQGGVRQGVWRFDQGDTEAVWEQIADATTVGNISSLACDEESGVLYAISSTFGTGYRWVKPAATKIESPDEIAQGLNIPAGDSVKRGLKEVSGPTLLFAVGGSSYTQIWMTSDQMVKVKLLAPADGSVAVGTILEGEGWFGQARVMLEWQGIQGADSYEVKVATDENLSSPIDISYYDDGTQYANGTVKVVSPWLGTKYYWSVRVSAPYLSQWSDTWTFTTLLGPTSQLPTLLIPRPGKANVILKPILQWNSSIAATSYELILAMNCDWSNPVLNLSGESSINGTAYQLTFDLAKNTSYCWKVRGVNDITHSPWSDTGTFTTGSPVAAENVGTPVWVWVIIALASILIVLIVILIVRSRVREF